MMHCKPLIALLLFAAIFPRMAFSDDIDFESRLYCFYRLAGTSEDLAREELKVAKQYAWFPIKHNAATQINYIDNLSSRKYMHDCRIQIDGKGEVVGLQGKLESSSGFFTILNKKQFEDQKALGINFEQGQELLNTLAINLDLLDVIGKKVEQSKLLPNLVKIFKTTPKVTAKIVTLMVLGVNLFGAPLLLPALKWLIGSSAPSIWSNPLGWITHKLYNLTIGLTARLTGITADFDAIKYDINEISNELTGGAIKFSEVAFGPQGIGVNAWFQKLRQALIRTGQIK